MPCRCGRCEGDRNYLIQRPGCDCQQCVGRRNRVRDHDIIADGLNVSTQIRFDSAFNDQTVDDDTATNSGDDEFNDFWRAERSAPYDYWVKSRSNTELNKWILPRELNFRYRVNDNSLYHIMNCLKEWATPRRYKIVISKKVEKPVSIRRGGLNVDVFTTMIPSAIKAYRSTDVIPDNEQDKIWDYENDFVSCTGCGYRQPIGSFSFHCNNCMNSFLCFYCGSHGDALNRDPNGQYCNSCMGTCDTCGGSIPPSRSGSSNVGLCRNCFTETWDDDTGSISKISPLEGRENVRTCGIEIEGGIKDPNGANWLASQLYSVGLNGSPSIAQYHHGSGFARVERDSSVDWELIIGPANMNHTTHVSDIKKALQIVRIGIKDQQIGLDVRCGTHIHIDAHKISITSAYNLHILFAYLEDLFYRLGSAKWPVHRCVIQGHNHNSHLNPKTDTKSTFARTFHGNKYYGLSFNNWFTRMVERCRCGAATYGVYEECTCQLNKCTFEFRVFNATANMTKIYAYLALCQALVAKAITMDEIKNPDDYPASVFTGTKASDFSASQKREITQNWKDGIKFIFEELPLSTKEKEAIAYCVEHSEVKEFTDYAKGLI